MKITLCGSTRFREEYQAINQMLSKHGHIVYSVSSFGHSGDTLTQDEKEMLDLVHLKKIAESDCIVVVGAESGRPYIGDSTRREIRWAKMLGKGVWFTAFGNQTLDQFRHVDNLYPANPRDA